MADGMLSLSWNNHSATFCHTLASLRAKERYTDVTVTCEGKFYPVHKLVLSTCSEYFENMFEHTPCKHPVVVLRDVKCDELEALLSYMYAGVVSVAQTDLPRLIKVAELLQIKGLAVPDEPPKPSHVIPNTQKYNSDKSSQHLLRRNTQVQSSSSVRSSPYPRSRPSRESCDSRISPQPKCTRSEDENIISQDRIQTPTVSPTRSKGSSHNTEADWQLEPTRSLTEQNLDLSTIAEIGRKKESSSQEAVSSQSQACEILIKEEMMEDIKDSETGASDTGLDYASVSSDGGLPSISRGDHLETTNLMMMKLEQSNSGQQPGLQPLIRQDTYPEGMSTTLPGPSDIQGWFGAETMTGLPMAKGDTRNDSQMFTCDTSQQAHKRFQMGLGKVIPRKKRTDLTLLKQIEVIHALNTPGSSLSIVAKQFDVSKSQVGRISRNRDSIIKAYSSDVDLNRKRKREGNNSDIGEALFLWFKQSSHSKYEGSVLREKAKQLAAEMGREFLPSKGWLYRWRLRYRLLLKHDEKEKQDIISGT
ncbi:uncharacterized protein [Panulirus ornatus]